jgi:hypothetical protein
VKTIGDQAEDKDSLQTKAFEKYKRVKRSLLGFSGDGLVALFWGGGVDCPLSVGLSQCGRSTVEVWPRCQRRCESTGDAGGWALVATER